MTDNSTTYNSKTYVHDGKEVILTGREAIKHKINRRTNKTTVYKLIEICPIAMKDKTTTMYHKWVDENELYHIIDNSSDSDEETNDD